MLKVLADTICKKLEKGNQPFVSEILCLASYKALNEFSWSNELEVNDDIKLVYKRQVSEPKRGNHLNRL